MITLFIRCCYVNQLAFGQFVDEIINNYIVADVKFAYISVDVNFQRFSDDQMTGHWYQGNQSLNSFKIHVDSIDAIEANAFDGPAFHRMTYLWISIGNGAVKVHSNAFHGMRVDGTIDLVMPTVAHYPEGLFQPIADTVSSIRTNGWPSSHSLNAMFNGSMYDAMHDLRIKNVQSPQTYFRHLAASNFTFVRQLKYLFLVNCGIEVIDERTFDELAHTLEWIKLNRNRIKYINVAMFRAVIESKWHAVVEIKMDSALKCNCQALEVGLIQYSPFDAVARSSLVACMPDVGATNATCARWQRIRPIDFCLKFSSKTTLRSVHLRMRLTHRYVTIQTNFTSKFRMLFLNLDAKHAKKCIDRSLKTYLKCWTVNRTIDRMELDTKAQFVALIAIPILYRFGVCPFHLIVVRQLQPIGWFDWVGHGATILVSILGGAIIGFGSGIWMPSLRSRWKCLGHGTPDQTHCNDVDDRRLSNDYTHSPYYIYNYALQSIDHIEIYEDIDWWQSTDKNLNSSS